MRSKSRRRPVHYVVFTFRDGAVVGCIPSRKPSKRKLKQDGDRIDADCVFREHYYTPSDLYRWNDELRVRFADLLTNRLNMRRTVRELVLPRLSDIEASLISLHKRLERFEQALAASIRS